MCNTLTRDGYSTGTRISGQRSREGMRRRSSNTKPGEKSGDLYTFHCLGNRLINRPDIPGCMVAPGSMTTFAGVTCFWISRASIVWRVDECDEVYPYTGTLIRRSRRHLSASCLEPWLGISPCILHLCILKSQGCPGRSWPSIGGWVSSGIGLPDKA